MNAIIGYGSLMERHWGEEEITWNYLCKQKKASRCLLSLINNVLEMARIESGKEVLRETKWSVQEFNDNVDVIMEGVIHEKQLQFERKFRVRHEQVLCDPLKVREIFMNLLSNAIKYTPAGGRYRWISRRLTVNRRASDLPDTDKGHRDWHQQGISSTSVRKVLTGTEFGRERNHRYRTRAVDCKITGRSDGRKYFG